MESANKEVLKKNCPALQPQDSRVVKNTTDSRAVSARKKRRANHYCPSPGCFVCREKLGRVRCINETA
ncbi:MAG: hypothetical protein ICV79_18485 [Flavisolibacter sp.]|nr:hypothetical protein [Flavisolibacter sp.]